MTSWVELCFRDQAASPPTRPSAAAAFSGPPAQWEEQRRGITHHGAIAGWNSSVSLPSVLLLPAEEWLAQASEAPARWCEEQGSWVPRGPDGA